MINDRDGRYLAKDMDVPYITTVSVIRKACLMGVIPTWTKLVSVYASMQPYDADLKSLDEPAFAKMLNPELFHRRAAAAS